LDPIHRREWIHSWPAPMVLTERPDLQAAIERLEQLAKSS
jgi:hypothetical protein